MNITDNLIRIKEGKDAIIQSLKGKGVSISENTLINEIPTIIDNAEIGGGGDTPVQPETQLIAKYEGASVFRISVPSDGYEFAINLCNDATKATYDVDWGDGSLEYGLTTDEQHHTYSKAGIYDVNIYNLNKDITLGGSLNINVIGTSSRSVVVSYLFNNPNNDYWTDGRYIENKDNTIINVLIGDKVTSIGDYAFQNSSSLQSVVIPEGVTSIKSYAFQNCSSLQSIVIPEGVTSIGDYTFQNSSSLQSVVIPEGVTSIENYTFQHCSSLQSVVIPEGVTSIGNSTFSHCSSLQSVVIPEGVTSIKSYAFEYCSSLQSVVIPEGVTSIENYAFQHCPSLQSIVIPEGVTSIGGYTFQICTSLQNIVIPEGVTSISYNAFSNCISLQAITINALTAPTITTSSFSTSNLKYTKRYLYVPKDSVGYNEGNWKTYLIDKGWELRYIEDYEKTPTTLKLKTKNNFFHNLPAIGQAKLIDYELVDNEYIYHFDDKITELIQYTFYNKVLEEIELPEGLEIIGQYTFQNCSSLQSVVIPNSVTTISEYAFSNCKLLQSITIPENVETIGESCFGDCTSLQSVVIYGGISKLEQNTFVRCSKLETIELPSTLTNIGGNTFKQTNRLSTITCKAMTAPTISSNSFDSIGTSVPSGTPKILRIPEGATGYDEGYWKSTVLDKGYTLEYIPLSEL